MREATVTTPMTIACVRILGLRAAAGLIVAAVLTASLHGQAPAAVAPPAAIPADALMTTVKTLASGDYEGRAAGTRGGERAREWIAARFKAIGLEPSRLSFEQPFSVTPRGSDVPVRAVNLIGTCAGTDPDSRTIVLSAHYDHLGVRDGRVYPGADDNASGVAALIEIAAVCVKRPFRHTVVVAAFDAEEMGLRGARAFLETPPVPRDRIALNVNLDMVARGDKDELYVSGLHHTPRLRSLLDPVAARAPIALRFGHDLPGTGQDDWTMQSDHGVFHEAGVPFVYFGVEDHPDYHQPTDTADKIDPEFFARAATTILDALGALDGGLK